MAIRFYSNETGSASASLWVPVTALPGDIKTDAAAGVVGIDTNYPPGDFYGLKLTALAGVVVAMFTYIKGTAANFVGHFEDAGARVIGLFSQDTVTGFESTVTLSQDGTIFARRVKNAAGENINSETNISSLHYVKSLATGSTSARSLSNAENLNTVSPLGILSVQERLVADRWQIRDGAASEVFAIKNNGDIQTNQIGLAIGNDNLPFKSMEIFDNAGASEGFVPVLSDPGTAHYATPAIATGGGAGAGAVSAVVGDDYSGIITITTGAVPAAAAVVVNLQYASAFILPPVAVISPANAAAAALAGLIVDSQTNPLFFQIVSSAAGVVAPLTVYQWNYVVSE